MGKQGRTGDDSAIVSLLRDTRTGILYVLDADIQRRRPDAIIEDIIAYHRRRNYQRFMMETNQFQKFLSDELERRSRQAGAYIPITGINNTTDKLGRIQRLQPLISSGTLRFSRRQVTLLEQLRQFPMGAHDDGPDALEMAVSAAGGWQSALPSVYSSTASSGYCQPVNQGQSSRRRSCMSFTRILWRLPGSPRSR